MSLVTLTLIILNVLFFIYQITSGSALIIELALWPIIPHPNIPSFNVWQLVTYSFLHGSLTHLLFNMLALFVFGQRIEKVFGAIWFLKYYFVCIIAAAATHLLATNIAGNLNQNPTVGASGGVFGLLLAYGFLFPNERLILLIPPIPIRAKYFVVLYGCLELFLGITGTAKGIAHFAHLGGMVGGIAMLKSRYKKL